MRRIFAFYIIFWIILLTAAPAFADSPAGAPPQVKSYAETAYKSYQTAYADALLLQKSVDAYLATPSDQNLKSAKDAWLKLRSSYATTEVFRFYEGPADNVQATLNQWPIDSDFINGLLTDNKFEITKENLIARNQEFDETQVTTGLNMIEYFLWKKELKTEREKQYLRIIAGLAVTDIKSLADAWEPAKENYAKEFLNQPAQQSLGKIMLGITVLSGFELAANRLENHKTKDAYSTLSNNTTQEFTAALKGIRNVYFGAGINLLVQEKDKSLAEKISAQMQRSEKLAEAKLSDDAVRRAFIDSLQIQAGLFKQAANKLELSLGSIAE